MSDPLGDMGRLLGDFGKSAATRAKEGLDAATERIRAREAAERVRQPLPSVRRKMIDGVAYLRADDVAAVLEALGADPRAKRLAAKLRGT